MSRVTFSSWVRVAVLGAFALAPMTACSSLSEEGESCDRANGNDDCENGLVCRPEWEIQATESVCCPRPPAKPSSASCDPEIDHYVPDPSIDGSFGAGGAGGAGGSAGSSGDSGTDASDAASDAETDAATDASSDGAAGAAGTSSLDAAGG